ncbi:MAG: hypothetical protein GZ086_04150 [Gelidibacter sp.]|nr:hypothetical protein [Gelidibacter sp.]
MKNKMLIQKFEELKNAKSIEIIEGTILSTLKGGLSDDGCTKCKPNSCSPQNITTE